MAEYHPTSTRDLPRFHPSGKKVLLGIFLGYELIAGGIWKGDMDLEDSENLDASEIYPWRINAKDVNITPTNTELHSMITFHHANTRGSRAARLRIAHLCVLNKLSCTCHVSFLAASDTAAQAQVLSLLSFRLSRQHTQDLRYTMKTYPAMFLCRVADQHKPSLTGYEPNVIETKVIEREDLEPRRIELDRNLGTDPSQIQESLMWENKQNPIAEDVEGCGKVGADMSYIHSQMHSDYDSAESIADSDLEDGEFRKMLSSPLHGQGREDCNSSRIPAAPGKPAA